MKHTFYHYGYAGYKQLQSRAKQGSNDPGERKRMQDLADIAGYPGIYPDHISLFIERIPVQHMGAIYKKSHEVWFAGNVITEYQIELSALKDAGYVLEETPEKREFYHGPLADAWYDENASEDERAKVKKRLNELRAKNHTIGKGTKELMKGITPFLGTTRDAFFALEGNDTDKYAPYVPHLMMWPVGGTIEIAGSRKVRIGDKKLG